MAVVEEAKHLSRVFLLRSPSIISEGWGSDAEGVLGSQLTNH
jgi:hypothetical protein